MLDINKQDILCQLQNQHEECALTGISVTFEFNRNQNIFTTASVDRVDSHKGYETDNIQILYQPVNTMKHVISNKQFIKMCQLINNEENK